MSLDKPNRLERCPGVNIGMEPNRTIMLVRTDQQDALTHKQQLDYREYRKSFLTWLLRLGKQPDKAEGYSPYTVMETGDRCARFDSWAWETTGHYRTPPTPELARDYMEEVAYRDVTESTKGKTQEALLRYSDWLTKRFSEPHWEFQWNFQSGGGNNGPRDFLSKRERRAIRQAALTKGAEDDWKFTSLVWVSLDAALRPVEVGRATTDWCDTENGVLRIPVEDSSKNEGNWVVSLTDRTTDALRRWLEQREERPRYQDTNRLWLTRENNRYGSAQLGRLLKSLCESADIEYENREMSWYAIRHSTGTYLADERDLAAVKSQLRHESTKTSLKYDNVPVEQRRDALDKIG